MKKLFLLLSLAISFAGNHSFAQFSKIMDFTGASNGRGPWGVPAFDGTYLYGMAEQGGANNLGTIFKIKPDGSGYAKLLDFAGVANGALPRGSLYFDGTFLYGLTYDGGINDDGVVFKIKPDGTGYVKLFDFTGGTTGYNSEVAGPMIFDGTYLYGVTTWGGGANTFGTIFKIKPDGTDFTKLHGFAGSADGQNPFGTVCSDGTYLYGMTPRGGANNHGIIYKIKTDGTLFQKILDFDGPSYGADPYGSLIYDGTYLFGMTQSGGPNDGGTIFKIKPDGSGYQRMHDFNTPPNGTRPLGALILQGGFLYGMGTEAGATGNGTIFRIKPDGTAYSVLYDFTGPGGSFPRGSLTSDGTYLYGMTNRGGTDDFGVVFTQALPTGIDEMLSTDHTFSVYPNPALNDFSISMNSEVKSGSIEMFNAIGAKVYSRPMEGKIHNIKGGEYPAGIYSVRIIGDNWVYTKSIIIQ